MRPPPYNLTRTAYAGLIAIPLGMAGFWSQGPLAAWAWAAGCVWMLANLYCLDRLIRAGLAPKEQIDGQAAALYGSLVLLVLPVGLLGLLFWARAGDALIPLTAGITLPLVLILLRTLGALAMGKRTTPGSPPDP